MLAQASAVRPRATPRPEPFWLKCLLKTRLVRTVQHGFAAPSFLVASSRRTLWVTVAYLLRDAFFFSGLWCPALPLRLELDESDKRTFVLRADVSEENGLFSIASEGLLAAGGKRLSTGEGYSVYPTAANDTMVAAGNSRFPYSLFGWLLELGSCRCFCRHSSPGLLGHSSLETLGSTADTFSRTVPGFFSTSFPLFST